MPTSPCLEVPRQYGERAILLIKQLGLFDPTLKINQENSSLQIPLLRELSAIELETVQKAIFLAKFCVYDFSEKTLPSPKTLVDILAEELPPHVIASLPHSADFIGDIAVLEISPELENYKQKIGEAVLETNKRIHTVLAKASAVEGIYRTRKFDVIAGEAKTITVHKEYGCIYHVDLSKAYFSPRLSNEHKRVAGLVKEGETIIDMFTGAGPFAIQIARQRKKVHVYAVDLNPYAIELLNKNVAANRVATKVTPILGDVRTVVHERLTGVADRVVMNLPEKAIEFVDTACAAIKPAGGIMHYYE
ncbi:MAG TPA: class I SAM-dependent methyltransferase family protein, partial [Candidatus Bathyarchaeia archaeon]|nr:class I SAM-dependent methyltransferase family protein [Candidatus Bathyarchaeia archaeon]